MTVLNPLRQIDERIMDDADMAGPICFFLAFGMFLLLVRRALCSLFRRLLIHISRFTSVRPLSIWIHLRHRSARLIKHLRVTQPHVSDGYRRVPDGIGSRLLSTTHGWCGRDKCGEEF